MQLIETSQTAIDRGLKAANQLVAVFGSLVPEKPVKQVVRRILVHDHEEVKGNWIELNMYRLSDPDDMPCFSKQFYLPELEEFLNSIDELSETVHEFNGDGYHDTYEQPMSITDWLNNTEHSRKYACLELFVEKRDLYAEMDEHKNTFLRSCIG